MKSTGSTSFLSVLVIVFVSFISTGDAFKQELWLYDAEDNVHLFHSHVSDTEYLSSFLPRVTTACTRGVWNVFSTVNFTTYRTWFGSVSRSDILCYPYSIAGRVKSLRHVAANDTDTDALSLYEGENWSGKEIFVTARAMTGITDQTKNIAITGTSDWMLFEGMNLDGKSACYKVAPGNYIYRITKASGFKLTTVGSVFKGCDAQEIKNYKMLQSPSL